MHSTDASPDVWCWTDNSWHSAYGLLISPLDRAHLYGDGVFETFRSRQRRFFRVDRHLSRLHKGMEMLGIRQPRALRSIRDILETCPGIARDSDLVFRVTVTRGIGWPEAQGEMGRISVLARPVSKSEAPPATLALSQTRRDEVSGLSSIKTCNWLPSIQAAREARARGFDDAILCCHAGYLSEATSSNLFWMSDGVVFTPSLICGALPGVTREAVLEASREAGIPAREGEFCADDLSAAQAVFLTNSVNGVRMVSRFEATHYEGRHSLELIRNILAALEQIIDTESA